MLHDADGAPRTPADEQPVTRRGMIRCVESLNLADAFVTLIAVLGPQKVLLSVVRMSHGRSRHDARLATLYAAAAAACVGVVFELTAPFITSFFHITTASVQLAAGLVFFVYAIGLVFGVHLGEESEDGHNGAEARDEHAGVGEHPVSSGFRALLLPFIVSPLGVAVAVESSLTVHDWGARGIVAAAYVAVAALDLIAVLVFLPLIHQAHPIFLEMLSRLLGILLSAVGANLFLQGLAALGVHIGGSH